MPAIMYYRMTIMVTWALSHHIITKKKNLSPWGNNSTDNGNMSKIILRYLMINGGVLHGGHHKSPFCSMQKRFDDLDDFGFALVSSNAHVEQEFFQNHSTRSSSKIQVAFKGSIGLGRWLSGLSTFWRRTRIPKDLRGKFEPYPNYFEIVYMNESWMSHDQIVITKLFR